MGKINLNLTSRSTMMKKPVNTPNPSIPQNPTQVLVKTSGKITSLAQAHMHVQAQAQAQVQAQVQAQAQAHAQAQAQKQAQSQAQSQAHLVAQKLAYEKKQAQEAHLAAQKMAYEKKQAQMQAQAAVEVQAKIKAQEAKIKAHAKVGTQMRMQMQMQAQAAVEVPDKIKAQEAKIEARTKTETVTQMRMQLQIQSRMQMREQIITKSDPIRSNASNETISIDIFTTFFIENIANALGALLTDCGIKCNVYIRNLTNQDIANCLENPQHYLFIFCPQYLLQAENRAVYPSGLQPLPANKYYLYQLEQLDTGHAKNMNSHIKKLIQHAKHTFDYSEINLPHYPADLLNKVSVLPPPVVPSPSPETSLSKKYDVLFCGSLTPRRTNILNDIKAAGYIVFHTADVFGVTLTKLIQEARIVLNIHNGESNALETCRLNEAVLSPDTHIISEKSSDTATHQYTKRVNFVETTDIVNTIKDILANSPLIEPFNACNLRDQLKQAIHINILYPNLFHKYILGLRNPNENMITKNYTVIKEAVITRKNICHIHCLHLTSLDQMFSIYLSPIAEIFDIIVTYTHEDKDNAILNKYNNHTFLKVNNYGMDIGTKFVVYEYLKNKDYNYIFFIHSKSTDNRRKEYLMPFMNNLNMIKNNITQDTISCFFNHLIWLGDGGNSNKWSRNEMYMEDIIKYLNIEKYKDDKQFAEGNFYILHKKIIELLFSDKLLYNILNSDTSFDLYWVKLSHGIKSNTIHDIYNNYKEHKLFGNNLETKKGHQGLADSMIEHVFERLPILLCKENNITINRLDHNNCRTIFSGDQSQQNMNIKTKTLCIIASHTSSDLKIKVLKHNHPYFQEITDDLIYINSSEFENIKLFENMLYIDNDYTVCYGKYLHALLNTDLSQYDNIILANDSFLITRSLLGFKDLFDPSIEMSALCCSNESMKHYPDFLRRYNKIGINKIIDFYKIHLENNKSFLSLIHNIEVKSHLYFNEKINVLYDAITNYKGNIHFDNEKLKDYLYNKNYPIIKIKKMQFTTYTGKELPSDFDPVEYKSLHLDLSEFSNTDATSHFMISGINEGRPYKKNQNLIYSEFLTEYLANKSLKI
jgi:hypothetical protein